MCIPNWLRITPHSLLEKKPNPNRFFNKRYEAHEKNEVTIELKKVEPTKSKDFQNRTELTVTKKDGEKEHFKSVFDFYKKYSGLISKSMAYAIANGGKYPDWILKVETSLVEYNSRINMVKRVRLESSEISMTYESMVAAATALGVTGTTIKNYIDSGKLYHGYKITLEEKN